MDKHPKWPKEGEHLFGKWMPLNKFREYRVCLHPNCHYSEERIAKG